MPRKAMSPGRVCGNRKLIGRDGVYCVHERHAGEGTAIPEHVDFDRLERGCGCGEDRVEKGGILPRAVYRKTNQALHAIDGYHADLSERQGVVVGGEVLEHQVRAVANDDSTNERIRK